MCARACKRLAGRKLIAVLCAALIAASGCGAARARPSAGAPGRQSEDRRLTASYVRQIPVGSRIRLRHATRGVVRGVLLRGDTDPVVIQRRARIPEPPLEVPLSEIVALEIDTSNGAGRAAAIGLATGAGAALGVFLVLVAIFAD